MERLTTTINNADSGNSIQGKAGVKVGCKAPCRNCRRCEKVQPGQVVHPAWEFPLMHKGESAANKCHFAIQFIPKSKYLEVYVYMSVFLWCQFIACIVPCEPSALFVSYLIVSVDLTCFSDISFAPAHFWIYLCLLGNSRFWLHSTNLHVSLILSAPKYQLSNAFTKSLLAGLAWMFINIFMMDYLYRLTLLYCQKFLNFELMFEALSWRRTARSLLAASLNSDSVGSYIS